MITFFSIPRGGDEHVEILKKAVKSWRKAAPKSQVVLFGDDPGVPETARLLRTDYVGDVSRNEHGTPLIDGVWKNAEELASNDWLMEISGDVLLEETSLRDVIAAVGDYARPFVIGQRWDSNPNATGLTLHAPCGVDYFLFRRGTLGAIPPFAVGRSIYDNWLVWASLYRWRMQVVDATNVIKAVHHYHSFSNGTDTKADAVFMKERQQNEQLARDTGCNRWSGVDEAQLKIKTNYRVVGIEGR